MNCSANLCTQGRQPCPTPWQCGSMHRVTVADVTRQEYAEFDEPLPIAMEDEPLPLLAYALLVAIAALSIGVAALPWIMEQL